MLVGNVLTIQQHPAAPESDHIKTMCSHAKAPTYTRAAVRYTRKAEFRQMSKPQRTSIFKGTISPAKVRENAAAPQATCGLMEEGRCAAAGNTRQESCAAHLDTCVRGHRWVQRESCNDQTGSVHVSTQRLRQHRFCIAANDGIKARHSSDAVHYYELLEQKDVRSHSHRATVCTQMTSQVTHCQDSLKVKNSFPVYNPYGQRTI